MGLGTAKSTPLISFNSIVDIDLGLLRFISKHYGENNVFDMNPLEDIPFLEVVGNIYRRKYKNPLYYIMKDEQYKDLLDKCYDEFLHDYEADILEESVTTEMINLINIFISSGEVIPTILCYSQAQIDYLEKEVTLLKDVEKILLEDAIYNINKFSHYYFKYIEEAEPFKTKVRNTVLYFSTCGLNLNEDNSDLWLSDEEISQYASQGTMIAIIDIYKTSLIGDYDNGN